MSEELKKECIDFIFNESNYDNESFHDSISIDKLKSFISSLLAKQQIPTAMTNSEWIAYGKKMGYHDYWKDMTRIALQEEFVNEASEIISQYSGISDIATKDLLADIKNKIK